MGELVLASGAIAGILFITAPPLPSISAQLPLNLSTPQPANADAELGLDKLIGIAQFVQNPTQYHVVHEGGLRAVTAASLKGDRMTIHYRYPTTATSKTGALKTGKLTGLVNSDGIFSGTHVIEDPSVQAKSVNARAAGPQDDVTFTFSADGTAQGHDVNGVLNGVLHLASKQAR